MLRLDFMGHETNRIPTFHELAVVAMEMPSGSNVGSIDGHVGFPWNRRSKTSLPRSTSDVPRVEREFREMIGEKIGTENHPGTLVVDLGPIGRSKKVGSDLKTKNYSVDLKPLQMRSTGNDLWTRRNIASHAK